MKIQIAPNTFLPFGFVILTPLCFYEYKYYKLRFLCTDNGIRTHTVYILSVATPTSWSTSANEMVVPYQKSLPTLYVRPEGFEPTLLLGLSQATPTSWSTGAYFVYTRWDSNPHYSDFKSDASYQLGYVCIFCVDNGGIEPRFYQHSRPL